MYRIDDDIHLEPSDFYWGKSPEKIHTVLGSCISVTVWNPVRKSGGMCHYMLTRNVLRKDGPPDPRYCEDSMDLIFKFVKEENLNPSRYQVKIFGGAAMFADGASRIGDANIRCAEEHLTSHGFIIAARHVGGDSSRHIVFELETGDVWVKTQKGSRISEADMDRCTDDSPVQRAGSIHRLGDLYG